MCPSVGADTSCSAANRVAKLAQGAAAGAALLTASPAFALVRPAARRARTAQVRLGEWATISTGAPSGTPQTATIRPAPRAAVPVPSPARHAGHLRGCAGPSRGGLAAQVIQAATEGEAKLKHLPRQPEG